MGAIRCVTHSSARGCGGCSEKAASDALTGRLKDSKLGSYFGGKADIGRVSSGGSAGRNENENPFKRVRTPAEREGECLACCHGL